MRTNIVIDDQLISKAIQTSGLKTRREAVHRGLELLIKLTEQKKIRKARGQLKWTGNLSKMRRNS